MKRLFLIAVAAVAVAGCGAAPHTREAGGVSALAVREVDWNPARTDVGHVAAVADLEEDVVVFGDAGATVFSSGAEVSVDRSVRKWIGAATIPAADGGASWIVGVDGDGRVRRLRGRSSFEVVSERYGLGADHVRGLRACGGKYVGFMLERDLGISDGSSVARFSLGALDGLAGGGGIAAAFDARGIRRIDPEKGTTALFDLEGVSEVVVDPRGRLFASTPEGVFAEGDRGDLELRFRSADGRVHGLAVSGARVWFADGGELGVLEGDQVSASTGARLAPGARLVGSDSGDVWALAGGGLRRFAKAGGPPWAQAIQPVFARACAGCHAPGGASGIDLSTPGAWTARRDALRQRVVVTRTMPPRGHLLPERDRDAIRGWLDEQK
jgi:hypothetical protein